MSNSLIPSQTGLTLRRTDTLITLTNKLLAKTGIKGISEMSDDELWEWWLGIDDEWKWLFLRKGLELKLWQNYDCEFIEGYNHQAEFDWLNRELVFGYIKELQKLKALDLWYDLIDDIAPLANLTQLTKLGLSGNQTQDIAPLANLTQLTELSLRGNPTQDIAPLANLMQLTYLDLWHNQIQDISVLANLAQLTYLDLSGNQTQDIAPLANLMQLTYLDLSENPINPQDIKWLRQQLPNCEIIF